MGLLAKTLGSVQPFRYRGYVFDEETGLYYLRSRYYNPRWGRFVNADSIITSNLFAYCHNEPVQFADFNGMLEQCGNKFSYKMFSEGAGVGSSGSGGGGGILLLITEVIPDALSYIGRKFTDAVIGFTMLFAGEAAYIGDLCVPQPNSISKDEAKAEALSTTPPSLTVIYRYGGTNPGNLTPKEKDKYSGLSFSTVPRYGAAATTIEAINATGVVYAVQDGTTHVSVRPVDATMEEWINEGSSSIWTQAVKSVVIRWDGGY